EYTLHCSTPWSFHALFFDGYPVPYYYELFTESFSSVIKLPEASLIPSLFTRITAQGYHCVELQNAKLLTDILTDLLLIRSDIIDRPKLPIYLAQLKESFDTNYAEHFSLDQLSDRFHINKYQICRDFKKYFNTTPLQYINDVRLTHAKELLHTTNLQINEISYRVGFENVNSFIQLFKKQIGTTPAAYRKNEY
ncbi:MAG: AraC family transcriptional regulator, partial [Lachnospiraceae bacterium]|nr:AraC family transcriptional regulator [Lachnospiraceae bacterium]